MLSKLTENKTLAVKKNKQVPAELEQISTKYEVILIMRGRIKTIKKQICWYIE